MNRRIFLLLPKILHNIFWLYGACAITTGQAVKQNKNKGDILMKKNLKKILLIVLGCCLFISLFVFVFYDKLNVKFMMFNLYRKIDSMQQKEMEVYYTLPFSGYIRIIPPESAVRNYFWNNTVEIEVYNGSNIIYAKPLKVKILLDIHEKNFYFNKGDAVGFHIMRDEQEPGESSVFLNDIVIRKKSEQ